MEEKSTEQDRLIPIVQTNPGIFEIVTKQEVKSNHVRFTDVDYRGTMFTQIELVKFGKYAFHEVLYVNLAESDDVEGINRVLDVYDDAEAGFSGLMAKLTDKGYTYFRVNPGLPFVETTQGLLN